jgi:hypothetical protein
VDILERPPHLRINFRHDPTVVPAKQEEFLASCWASLVEVRVRFRNSHDREVGFLPNQPDISRVRRLVLMVMVDRRKATVVDMGPDQAMDQDPATARAQAMGALLTAATAVVMVEDMDNPRESPAA